MGAKEMAWNDGWNAWNGWMANPCGNYAFAKQTSACHPSSLQSPASPLLLLPSIIIIMKSAQTRSCFNWHWKAVAIIAHQTSQTSQHRRQCSGLPFARLIKTLTSQTLTQIQYLWSIRGISTELLGTAISFDAIISIHNGGFPTEIINYLISKNV